MTFNVNVLPKIGGNAGLAKSTLCFGNNAVGGITIKHIALCHHHLNH